MGINEKAWGIGFKRMIGDPSLGDGETYGICVDETVRQIHICDIGDSGTDWARSVSSHPELCIHSATTPETYYLKMYSAGATAYIDAVGATTLQLLVAGTAEISIAGSSISPTTTNGAALGTTSLMWSDLFLASGGVINFNANDVTITHSTDKLTVASTWTASTAGRPFGVNLTLSVVGGGYVNALKGYVDCTTGDGGSTGLVSAVNSEIAMPAQCRGAYYPLEAEWVGGASTVFDSPGTGSQSGFLWIAASGTVDYMDSKGVFFSINGLTAEATGLLSADSQTLRVDVNQGTTRYLVMSQAENYLSLNCSTLGNTNDRIASLKGTQATPNMVDGYGLIESELSVSGTATGIVALTSAWINLGDSATIPTYCHVHTDGIYDATAILTNAYLSWGKYSCQLSSNPKWCSLWELNFSGADSEVDSIFNCNDMDLALGYLAGTPTDNAIGTIPFCSNAGSGIKYIRLYDSPTA